MRLFKNGVEVKEGPKAASTAALPPGALNSSNVKPPAGITEMHERASREQGDEGEQGGASSAERAAALHADLKRIATRTAAYTKVGSGKQPGLGTATWQGWFGRSWALRAHTKPCTPLASARLQCKLCLLPPLPRTFEHTGAAGGHAGGQGPGAAQMC